MKFDYQNVFELMQAYQELGKQKGVIVSFLFQRDVFHGSYSDLTAALGMKPENMPNIRKALKYLAGIGIVYIHYTDSAKYDDDGNLIGNGSMESCFLVDGWMENLFFWYVKNLAFKGAKKNYEDSYKAWMSLGCPEANEELNSCAFSLIQAYRQRYRKAKGFKSHVGVVDISPENLRNFCCDVIFDGDPKTISAIEAEPDALKKLDLAKSSNGEYLIWS